MNAKVWHQPKTTRTQKAEFISANFPELLSAKNVRLEGKAIERLKLAMYEAGLYSRTYDKTSPSIDSSLIRLIEKMQDVRLNAARENKK